METNTKIMRRRDYELTKTYIDRQVWQQVTTPKIGILHELVNKLLAEVESITGPGTKMSFGNDFNLASQLEAFEVEMIRHALFMANGNQVVAAKLLGVKYTTLNQKIKRFNLDGELANRRGVMPPAGNGFEDVNGAY